MKILLNPDEKIVKLIREGLVRTGGYCPCRRERTPENICLCEEFRSQVADPAYEGFCHCRLYYKSLEETPAGYSQKEKNAPEADALDDLG